MRDRVKLPLMVRLASVQRIKKVAAEAALIELACEGRERDDGFERRFRALARFGHAPLERYTAKTVTDIEGLEREWRDALCRKDMEKLRSLVHPDFVLIGTRSTGPSGSTPPAPTPTR